MWRRSLSAAFHLPSRCSLPNPIDGEGCGGWPRCVWLEDGWAVGTDSILGANQVTTTRGGAVILDAACGVR